MKENSELTPPEIKIQIADHVTDALLQSAAEAMLLGASSDEEMLERFRRVLKRDFPPTKRQAIQAKIEELRRKLWRRGHLPDSQSVRGGSE